MGSEQCVYLDSYGICEPPSNTMLHFFWLIFPIERMSTLSNRPRFCGRVNLRLEFSLWHFIVVIIPVRTQNLIFADFIWNFLWPFLWFDSEHRSHLAESNWERERKKKKKRNSKNNNETTLNEALDKFTIANMRTQNTFYIYFLSVQHLFITTVWITWTRPFLWHLRVF